MAITERRRSYRRQSASENRLRATPRLLLICGACIVSASAVLVAQAEFAKSYMAGEAAFNHRDLNDAEHMFLASLQSPDAPKKRGGTVKLVSQQYGYYPEVFLTLIYQQEQRYSDVLSYGVRARKYLKRSDPRYDQIVKAEDEATRALANLPHDLTVTWLRTPDSQNPTDGMFALVIAINEYSDPTVPRLTTAIADGVAITAILHERYGFETTFLADATKSEILSALDRYQTLSESSSLLIYYAGHGTYDKTNDSGYWIPSDARKTNAPGWPQSIRAADVTNRIRAIRARHILLISDSCYSGRFMRNPGDPAPAYTEAEHEQFVQRAAAARSRNLMSSGFDEPVSDLGGGDHSVFAAALLTGLGSISKPSFTAGELFYNYVAVPVTVRAPQRPQYMPIQGADPGGGDFVFHRVVR
jgi:hypothetical protein